MPAASRQSAVLAADILRGLADGAVRSNSVLPDGLLPVTAID